MQLPGEEKKHSITDVHQVQIKFSLMMLDRALLGVSLHPESSVFSQFNNHSEPWDA